MHHRWTVFFVFRFRNPHILKCRERRKNRSANPSAILPLWWCNDLRFCGSRDEVGYFGEQAVFEVREHGVSSRLLNAISRFYLLKCECQGGIYQDDISEEIFLDIGVALSDGVEDYLVDTLRLLARERGIEKSFWYTIPCLTD